ncbi:alpha-1,6-glucosidase domain-containing protein [Ideonella sp. BN130291]|uniref:alpha-1,6-glucosidase domain-containing protein n=1 Tax=Ideonella sp. BN130291 TaxID=3112940 RepID=UPI002E26473D|nr:alpha-1,6-glucosidase domain-containing protein [Ideonella sp. BN130291]
MLHSLPASPGATAPATPPAHEAAAVWLDPTLIQWPQVAGGEERFRLLYSQAGCLVAVPGQPVQGADAAAVLRPRAAALPDALAKRFKYLQPGVVLTLDAAASRRLPQWLKGQLLLVREDAQGRVLQATRVQHAAALDALYAAAEQANDLGASATGGRTSFKLWAPTAQQVSVCLYPDGDKPARSLRPLRFDPATGVWAGQHKRMLTGRSYTYLVDVFVPGVGLVRNRVTDPYSLSLNTDSRRSQVVQLDDPAFKPPQWDAHTRPDAAKALTDLVIYELHLRDFSISDATVPPAHRGKYLAFTDTGSNGMKHLKGLADAGLTDVHLLPVFDMATVPEAGCVTPSVGGAPDGTTQQAAVVAVKDRDCFNWGYDPLHYTAPEGSYATDAANGAVRVREFRHMVMALHAAGLRVGMDVVYNHTAASGQRAHSVLDRVVPGYYHRLDARGQVERSTCCDNTATEHRMMGKLLIDSVLTWARAYGIDSFRFDLMAHQPRALMERLQQRLKAELGRDVPLLGEGWNFGEVADGARFVQASQHSLNGSGIGTFSDRGRDAVRGGSAGDAGEQLVQRQGWINGLGYDRNLLAPPADRAALLKAADLVRVGLAGTLRSYRMNTAGGELQPLEAMDYAGQPAGYASQPAEVVNYVENHDNQTLYDNNALKLPRHTSREDRARVQLLGAAVVAFSQGVAYFHAGQDVLRSKSLDRNSYDSGDHFNRLDWTYTDNGFGAGLPPEQDNGTSWPVFRPLLADPQLKPTPADIAWTRDAFRDLLRIRASSSLFRLRSADEVQRRLSFFNTGPQQEPTVVAAVLDGRGLADAGFAELAYLINVDLQAHEIDAPALRGHHFTLHPVHTHAGATDTRAATARFDAERGRFTVPPRTAVVFVVR